MRNDNSTRILAAEPRVSQSELDLSVFGSVDLKVGPVGIVIPISGMSLLLWWEKLRTYLNFE